MRLREFPEEPRLSDAGFSHHRRDLPVPGPRPVQGLTKLLHLVVTADEAREAARCGGLEARAYRRRPRHLVDLDGRLEPLDRHRAERFDHHVAFRQRQGLRRDQDRAGRRHLLHASGEVRRLADRRVVHVKVASDGSYDDLPRVQAHPDLDRNALGPPDAVGVPFHRFLHRSPA
jgi:hypothetical protein